MPENFRLEAVAGPDDRASTFFFSPVTGRAVPYRPMGKRRTGKREGRDVEQEVAAVLAGRKDVPARRPRSGFRADDVRVVPGMDDRVPSIAAYPDP